MGESFVHLLTFWFHMHTWHLSTSLPSSLIQETQNVACLSQLCKALFKSLTRSLHKTFTTCYESIHLVSTCLIVSVYIPYQSIYHWVMWMLNVETQACVFRWKEIYLMASMIDISPVLWGLIHWSGQIASGNLALIEVIPV